MGLWEKNQKQALPPKVRRVSESNPAIGQPTSSSPRLNALSGSVVVQYSTIVASDDSCVLTKSATSKCMEKQEVDNVNEVLTETIHSQTSDCGSAHSAVEDCVGEPATSKSDHNSSYNIASVECSRSQIDADRIGEELKKRKSERLKNTALLKVTEDEMDGEAWIERELEQGIEAESNLTEKRRKIEVF